jgi:hypothetical protein
MTFQKHLFATERSLLLKENLQQQQLQQLLISQPFLASTFLQQVALAACTAVPMNHLMNLQI